MSKYLTHVETWKSCTACSLSTGRKHVVFLRGTIPCDILFVGEAPGVSEDTLGKPFIGPAGKLLSQIIESATKEARVGEPRIGLTNLVSCFPHDGSVPVEPKAESIAACSPKLHELIRLSKPTAIICVGKLAQTAAKKQDWKTLFKLESLSSITHPAAILRQDVALRPLSIEQCVVEIASVFSTVLIPF
jgi:DNA polymerase